MAEYDPRDRLPIGTRARMEQQVREMRRTHAATIAATALQRRTSARAELVELAKAIEEYIQHG